MATENVTGRPAHPQDGPVLQGAHQTTVRRKMGGGIHVAKQRKQLVEVEHRQGLTIAWQTTSQAIPPIYEDPQESCSIHICNDGPCAHRIVSKAISSL